MSKLTGTKWETKSQGTGISIIGSVAMPARFWRPGYDLLIGLARDIDGAPFLFTTDEKNLKREHKRRRDLETA